MNEQPAQTVRPWLNPENVLGWQAALITAGRDQDDTVDWLEVLLRLVTFCEVAGLSIQAMRQQPIYTFFEEDVTLQSIPAWLRDYLNYRDGKMT